MNKRLVKSLIINVLVVFVLFIMFHPCEKTDDYIMKLILEGATSGKPDAHLLYLNYFLGKALHILFSLFPFIPWFELFQYSTLFVSFLCFTYVMYDEEKEYQSLATIIPVLLYFGFEGYIKLTFTKTAGIAGGVGFLLIFISLFQKKNYSMRQLIVGIVLTTLGILIRYKTVYALTAIFFGIILLRLGGRLIRRRPLKQTMIRIGVVLAMFIMARLIFSVGSLLFKMDPDWAAYKEYNSYKTILQDYGWPDYNEYQNEYEKLGITYNDYVMWADERNYSDPDRFTNEMMASVIELKKNDFSKYLTSFRAFFLDYPQEYVRMSMALVVFCLFFMVLAGDHKNKVLGILYLVLVNLLLDYYLYANGRYGRLHVEVATWFMNAMYCCYFLRESKVQHEKIYSTVLMTFLVFVYNIRTDSKYINNGTYTGVENTISVIDARYITDRLSENKENLYVLSNDEYYGIMRGYKSWHVIPKGKFSNFFVLSSYAYPTARTVLDNYGITNIYASMLDDNVYYATSYNSKSDNVQTILSYLKEHYDPQAKVMQVEYDRGVSIYKFYSEKREEPEPDEKTDFSY